MPLFVSKPSLLLLLLHISSCIAFTRLFSYALRKEMCCLPARVGVKLRLTAGIEVSDTEQFLVWENEEVELQKIETSEKIRLMTESGESIPSYMLDMLRQLGDSEEAVPEGKLPIVAVIGRPNTGKSTIVNKMTSSYKVTTFHLRTIPSAAYPIPW